MQLSLIWNKIFIGFLPLARDCNLPFIFMIHTLKMNGTAFTLVDDGMKCLIMRTIYNSKNQPWCQRFEITNFYL